MSQQEANSESTCWKETQEISFLWSCGQEKARFWPRYGRFEIFDVCTYPRRTFCSYEINRFRYYK